MDKASPELHRDLERFRELALADDQLLHRLRQTGDLESFVALSVQLGQAHDCLFSAQEVRALVQTEWREWLQRWV
jgi:hypothetical protein